MPTIPTALTITGVGVDLPDFALRDLTLTLAPINQAAVMARTLNGELLNLALPQFQNKYVAVISGGDQESPKLKNVAVGTAVVVTLPPQLGDDESMTSLNMRVGLWNEQLREWAAVNTWSLPLESI